MALLRSSLCLSVFLQVYRPKETHDHEYPEV